MKYKIVWIVLVTLFIFAQVVMYLNNNLSKRQALIMLFGNYDPTLKHSIWENMDFPKEKYDDFFWENKTGIVSDILYQSYRENGIKKYILLTKTVPKGIPYECHICYPLLSVAIFSRHWGKWSIENENLFLMQEGEYACAPNAKLVRIGSNKYGLILEAEHRNITQLDNETSIIILNNNAISIAHQEITYFDNFNHCGQSIPCTTFFASIDFDKTKNIDFYPLQIKRFGTKNDETQEDIAVPVNEKSIYEFRDGKYVQITWHGVPKQKKDYIPMQMNQQY